MPPLAFFQTTAPMLLIGFAVLAFQSKAFKEDATSPLNPHVYTTPLETAYLGTLAGCLFVGTAVGEFMALRVLYTGHPSATAARWVLLGLGLQFYCLITPVLTGFLADLRTSDQPWVAHRQVRLATALLAVGTLVTLGVAFAS